MNREHPAFETEVLPYQEELYASALRMTRDGDAARDLVQETFLRALSAWDRYQPGSNCRAWLHRILKNSYINHYRRHKRYLRFAGEQGQDAVVAFYGDDAEKSADPRREMYKDELGDEVSGALSSLGDDYRKVVELADLKGIRYKDIANALEVPIGTVMSRLFRARRQLEGKLKTYAQADYGIARAAA